MTLRIAVVEDDESIRTMLEYYFKSMGHEVLALSLIHISEPTRP